ncbi:MAG: hypothetical protein R8K22_02960 [Mariprofundaceae bacterium]
MNQDNKLFDQIRQQLDHDAEQIDAKTRFQLTQTRKQALQSQTPQQHISWRIPGVISAISVGFLVIVLWQQPSDDNTVPTWPNSDFELLATEEDIEFYEDLDFYDWLEKNNAS